tara:strand:+ start:213 stop:1598 length:1386 start_codon:yes stop_codon:yes gene_type:complete
MSIGIKGTKRKRSNMNRLDKLILESLAELDIFENTKPKDLPKSFIAALEKRYGPVDDKDFFSDDLSTYMKYTGTEKESGSVGHKVINLPSFFKMYKDFDDLIDDIKELMRQPDIRQDKAARELFDLFRTNFRKLQRYLRTERPEQYEIIRMRAALQEIHGMFVSHGSLIKEQRADELKIGRVKNIDIFIQDQSSFADTMFYILVDTKNGKEYQVGVDVAGEEVDLNYVKEEIPILAKMGFPDGDTIGNFIVKDINKELDEGRLLKESMLDSIKEEEEETEEPTPEEAPDTSAPEETILEDATDTILAKFPTLKAAIVKLQTEDFKQFVDSIDWISPRPTSFRINLKNGQEYIIKWTGSGFEAQILGKRYYLDKVDSYQQALDKLAILYRQGPMTGAGDGESEPVDADSGGGGGGGGDFPGEEGGGGEGDAVDDLGGEEGDDAPEADLGGEEIDFEDGAEPE